MRKLCKSIKKRVFGTLKATEGSKSVKTCSVIGRGGRISPDRPTRARNERGAERGDQKGWGREPVRNRTGGTNRQGEGGIDRSPPNWAKPAPNQEARRNAERSGVRPRGRVSRAATHESERAERPKGAQHSERTGGALHLANTL